ncbi:hypothetical protein [Mycobacterium sp. 236(2023)]|uniref:hypothetical protein n=1 Tax=Mycobacterium sp. 236(2023) TaxID=3038163 RepID=UPI00241571EC|nr:hypothetical protein [Mycobacterium sp. 236(2023)]MDG4663660.1 hypothetical protein [Mycobacterium sp. 236(2023)]
MTSDDDRIFKAFTDFGIDDIEEHASVSRRMLKRLSDIDDGATPGPRGLEARAALATSVVAHAVVELESELLEVKRLLAARV